MKRSWSEHDDGHHEEERAEGGRENAEDYAPAEPDRVQPDAREDRGGDGAAPHPPHGGTARYARDTWDDFKGPASRGGGGVVEAWGPCAPPTRKVRKNASTTTAN